MSSYFDWNAGRGRPRNGSQASWEVIEPTPELFGHAGGIHVTEMDFDDAAALRRFVLQECSKAQRTAAEPVASAIQDERT